MQKTPDFMPEFRANLPRTDHVLSHDFSITATTGHLNPVFHTIMNPGETIKLAYNFNLRTMPLEAAAFGDFICHTEYFFVPMQLLYQPFETAVYGISDQFSSNFGTGSITANLPLLDMQGIIDDLFNGRDDAALFYPETTIPVESKGQSAIRLLDLLGYCPIGVACQDQEQGSFYNPNVFPYPILAYNCIYQNYYRLDARERFDNRSFNLDQYYSRVQPLTNTEYDEDYLLMKYRPLDNDYFTDVKVSPIVDVLNLVNKSTLPSVNSWLAQNDNVSVDAASANTGIFSTFKQVFAGQNALTGQSTYSNDFDSSIRLLIDEETPASSDLRIEGYNVVTEQYVDDSPAQIRTPHVHSLSVLGQQINTANIRAMFANEKLWSITGRAKKNYDDQTLAHFGFKVPHDVKHQISKFGHDVSRVHVGEVISTASTSLSPLGEIAGKGYGVQQVEPHSFTAPCHGVVMAIFSVVVDRNYEAGILKANCIAS